MITPGGNDYNVHLIDLPCRVYGICVLLDDASYDVLINQRQSAAVQRDALAHEIRHMDKGDLYDDISTVEDMEREAHYRLKPV